MLIGRITVASYWWSKSTELGCDNKVSSIAQADALETMGQFWDTHDLTDFWLQQKSAQQLSKPSRAPAPVPDTG